MAKIHTYWLNKWGEPLLLGPGSIHVAHTPHERLAKRELREAVELYVKVAKGLAVQAHAGLAVQAHAGLAVQAHAPSTPS
jgi:hypothetical protein